MADLWYAWRGPPSGLKPNPEPLARLLQVLGVPAMDFDYNSHAGRLLTNFVSSSESRWDSGPGSSPIPSASDPPDWSPMSTPSSPPPPVAPLTPTTPGPSVLPNSLRKTAFKEKILQMYELLWRAEDPKLGQPAFWDEFFLLRPKTHQLEADVAKLSAEQLVTARPNLNGLFRECVLNLAHEHHIRVIYGLQTLCGLVRAVMKRWSGWASGPPPASTGGLDLIQLLMGLDVAEARMQKLIAHVNDFLKGDEPASLKDLCLKLLTILASGMDNVSQNTLLEYIMVNSVYESLIHLLYRSESRVLHGHAAVFLLTMLIQYRKYEFSNPYSVKLSILDQEMPLHGYANVITNSLMTYTQSYEASVADQSSSGWLSSITSIVGNMFVSDEGSPRIEQMRARNSVLLALYESVHLNRNFIATLAQYQTETASPKPTPSQSHITLGEKPISVGPVVGPGEVQSSREGCDVTSGNSTPSNLLVTFLEYCSIIMQDTKTESSQNTNKLSFLILLCITEDQYANALMHDANLTFRVKMHKAPMRHRKAPVNWDTDLTSKSLAVAVLDLMVEFVRSHMMKRLPHELYLLCLAVIHRLLAYQKRSRVRLHYPWKELWTALIGLLKFVAANESNLVKKMNIFAIGLQVVVIFNLFVTYGDTFLPSPSSYDELYYEIARCHQTFDSLYSISLRYSTSGGEFKDSAVRLTNALVNIRAIIAHFNPKIDAWLSAQQLSTPTEEQILDVVKSNYDSLTLKLQEGLDQYEPYVESPRHAVFFTNLVRNVVHDTRQNIVLNDLELQTVLQDFSTIQ
eukprot:maker-scaffold156_size297567-snap-gene-0.24 protein:Tk07666 transcript:maker-scaffold156_size297567-snap-gene-0.24-mRNA-1 annotation:"hypothetical protein L798_14922"